MRDFSQQTRLLLLSGFLASLPMTSGMAGDADIDFFEKKIRPILVEHCYKCHSEEAEKKDKLRGGLRLDSRTTLLKGGDSGSVLVPGKPTESLLIKTLHYTNEVKMPPKGKLPDGIIKDFEHWIKIGAPDPRIATSVNIAKKQVGLSIEEGRKFWSYKPVTNPIVPQVKSLDWIVNDIDRFILSGLESKNLRPAPETDKVTLIRRLYFDLIGLPPTPEEVDRFVRDTNPKAYEKLVDQLLGSPAFGERWGRHWMDVSRFAESVTLRGFIFPEAWRYRDYVIDSFNRDLPFNQFIQEQIAGDLLPWKDQEDHRRKIVATTFLMLGNTNLEEQDKKQLRMDVVDEMLDVIGKGFLAQTITCARCHDHKFDPIPTKDYYALAGILRNVKAMEHANVSKWVEVPLPVNPETEAELKKQEDQITLLQEKIKKIKVTSGVKTSTKGILAIQEAPGIVVDDSKAKKVGEWMNSIAVKTYIGDGYIHDKNEGKGEKTVTFQPELLPTGKYEVWFAYSPGTNRADNVPVTVFGADGEKTIVVNMKKEPPIEGRYISLGEYQFEKTGQSFVIVSNEGTKGHVTPDAVLFLSMNKEKLPSTKDAKPSGNEELKSLEDQLKQLQQRKIKRPMAMSVIEETKIEDTRIHIRGLVGNQGQIVPRGFLQVANRGSITSLPKNQSGRKELSDWIASKENPLTSRVIANRAWHWLFGSGIVRTVDNFGTTGELPSHPELLDYLANSFIQEGWSIKKLVRQIVLSRTYRQSSILLPDSAILKVDPENKLFGRANRRRLDAEAIRDTLLSVSGKLNLDRGGPTFSSSLSSDYGFKHSSTRRSVYLPLFRNSLPEIFDTFDFADPSMVTGRRNTSTVAPQALYFLNNSFPIEQASHAANRLLSENLKEVNARIIRAYRLSLGREPTQGEIAIAKKFLAKQADEKVSWTTLFQMLFASADFRYLN